MTISELKKLSKSEFIDYVKKTYSESEQSLIGDLDFIYDRLQNAKSGFIKVTHRDTKAFHKGHTDAFVEGLSVQMNTLSSWFHTSIIQEINWAEKWFRTLNSIYDFEFIEDEVENKSEDAQ